MKVIIAGSRDAEDIRYLQYAVVKTMFDITEVVCGGARGADTLGEEWAKANNIPIAYFIPEWKINNILDRAAGIKRNIKMGDYADALIALWDGQSKGTEQMIQYMNKLRKPVEIISVIPPEVSDE